MSWSTAPLEEISDVIRGVTFSKSDAVSTPGSGLVPVLRAGNISDALDTSNGLVFVDEARVSEKQRLKPEDIVVCTSSGSAAVLGKSALLEHEWEGSFGAFLATVRTDKAVASPRFVSHFLRSPLFRSWASNSAGSGIKNIRASDFKQIKIPLPPLEEQKRIAGILDQADALCRLRRRALDRLNTLGQAIFYEMFGDVPDESVKKLTDVAELINGDRSSNYPSGDDLKDDGVLFLSTKNIRDWRLVLDRVLHITEEKFATLSRGKLLRGDLVITLRGTLGQAAIFDCEFDTGFINAQMMIIRPKEGISSQYLLDFLSLDSTQFELNKGQSGSAVKQLTAKKVGELPIVIPSTSQQSEYGLRIAAHQEPLLVAKAQLQAYEALFSSLQHRAFRGEL